MHSQLHANTDNESLQTDVMRFMAIIAFCLIAILTLVKNVDAPPPVIEPVAKVPEPPVAEPERIVEPNPAVFAPSPPVPVKPVAADEPTVGPSSPAARQKDEGLSLRFASEGDFLRLISRGDVTVFAYRDDTVWALSRDYVFRNSRAPKQIYELESNTIPRLVSEAFLRNHASPSNFTWGVSLPRRIESQIQSYIQRVGNGVLLIDRFGEVRHVGTS